MSSHDITPMSSADFLRAKGWTPGTTLNGRKGEATATVKLTAIGETVALAKRLSSNGRADERPERMWNFISTGWIWEPAA